MFFKTLSQGKLPVTREELDFKIKQEAIKTQKKTLNMTNLTWHKAHEYFLALQKKKKTGLR